MEKYLMVEGKLKEDCLKYKENVAKIEEIFINFKEQYNIETNEYNGNFDVLYIMPTENDIKNFNKILNKDIGNGLRPFRKNSGIAKAWTHLLNEKNIKLSEPHLEIYFNDICGKYSYRLFDIDDNIYCSIKMDHNFETPEGMKEMKASEFFKIIEDYEDRVRREKVNN